MMTEFGIDTAKVTKVIRLGERLPAAGETQEGKPRPIKLVLQSEDSKWELLKKAKNLSHIQEGAWAKVFVHQDLTLNQREKRNKQLKELADRKASGETDLILFRGRITKKRTTQS